MTIQPNLPNTAFVQNYQSLKQGGIDSSELQQLAKQAVANSTIEADELAVFQDIVQSQGALSKADLQELPPLVRNLFDDMGKIKSKLPPTEPQSLDSPTLSPARQEMKTQLDKVLTTSRWGYVPTKAEKTAGKRNLFEGMSQMPKGTTCGMLPGSMLKHMGVVAAPISGNATNGMESEGKRLGIWVASDGAQKPKAGDIYTLRSEDKPDAKSGVAHVGIIYDTTDDNIWRTADSGQGAQNAQSAGNVPREMSLDKDGFPQLSAPLKLDDQGKPIPGKYVNAAGEFPGFRRIAGWVDTDRLMFLQTYQDKLIGTPDVPKGSPQQKNAKGIGQADLQELAKIAMRDGSLNDTEIKVFTEIAHHMGSLTAEDIQTLSPEIQSIFAAAKDQPAPSLIPLPGDVPDNRDNPKVWTRRKSVIQGTGLAESHS